MSAAEFSLDSMDVAPKALHCTYILSFVDLLVSYAAISGTAKNASTPPIAIDFALIPVA